MGAGIAAACLASGMDVVLKEVNPGLLEAGLGRVRANVGSLAKKRKQGAGEVAATLARLRGTTDYAGFDRLDMVVEAVLEDLGLKQRIFAELEAACDPGCLLTTNTSTIDITAVAAKCARPHRVLGAHFFSPAHVMQLFEIVRGVVVVVVVARRHFHSRPHSSLAPAPSQVRTPSTSAQAVVDTLGFSKRLGKTPIVVGNCTGFAVNRVFFPYTMAACLAVDLGVDPYRLDALVAGTFGMPMGPFRLSDLVGGDVGSHVGANIVAAFPDRVYPATLIPSLVAAGRLGEKSGAGFYRHDAAARRAAPDPAGLAPFLAASRQRCPLPRPSAGFSDDELLQFVWYPVVNEAARVIDERVVDKASDLDVASVLGMGFPAWRGGLVHWADEVGAARCARGGGGGGGGGLRASRLALTRARARTDPRVAVCEIASPPPPQHRGPAGGVGAAVRPAVRALRLPAPHGCARGAAGGWAGRGCARQAVSRGRPGWVGVWLCGVGTGGWRGTADARGGGAVTGWAEVDVERMGRQTDMTDARLAPSGAASARHPRPRAAPAPRRSRVPRVGGAAGAPPAGRGEAEGRRRRHSARRGSPPPPPGPGGTPLSSARAPRRRGRGRPQPPASQPGSFHVARAATAPRLRGLPPPSLMRPERLISNPLGHRPLRGKGDGGREGRGGERRR